MKGLGSPGPAEPGTGFFRSVPWTMQAESWGPLPAAPKAPQACSETPTRWVPLRPLGRWRSWSRCWGGGSVFLTGHHRQPGLQGQFHPLWTFPRPAEQGLGVCGTPQRGGNEKGNRCLEVSRSGAESSLGAPRVRPAPRWHLRASGSTAGQNRNFLGPSGRLRERGVDAMICRARHKRVRTTTPGMLHRPEAYNAHRTPGAYGLRLQLPACSAELRWATPTCSWL